MNLAINDQHMLGQSELEKIDQLVSDYLLFRSFKQTQQQLFLDKRHPSHSTNKESGRHQRATIQRILNALDSGDYPRLVTLWDTYITQKIGTVKSTLIAVEAREAEFLANIGCAIYPFRSEVIQIAGSPAVAAEVAARSMTIFKHFLETRGHRLVQHAEQEFAIYRNIYKIAFPPSHPQYKHLFTDEWINGVRSRIVLFLEKFFTPSDLPLLCNLFERLSTKSESDLKEIFRRREKKLLKFTRSVYTLSNDLLTALEAGKTVDKAFLVSFRNRFNTFDEVMRPDNDFEEEMGCSDFKNDEENLSSLPNISNTNTSPQRKRLSPIGKSDVKTKIMHKIADLGHLDYNSMARDIAFMSSEVGSELGGLLTRDFTLTLADAAVKRQVAMQGCVLLNALVHYISRPDKEVQSQSSRNSAVMALCRADILGLRSATTQQTFVDITSGSIGLESRSITKFLFSLAEAMKRIPEPLSPRNSMMESLSKSPPYERLLIAGEMIAEYACRLVAALCTAAAGVSYLLTFGVRLTAALADFLVALPVPGSGEYSEGSFFDTENFDSPDAVHRDGNKRGSNGIRTWCLIALTLLTSNSKTNQLVVLKRGGVSWLSKTLGVFVSEVAQAIRDLKDGEYDLKQIISIPAGSTANSGIFEMSLSLLSIIITCPEAQRYLVGSLNMQRETEGLVGGLILLAASPGRSEYQANIVIRSLQLLLREALMREIVRSSPEILFLRQRTLQRSAMSIDFDVAKILLETIDSTALTSEEVSNDNPEVDEILECAVTLQLKMPEHPLHIEYSSGMSSTGLAFLLRYTSTAGRIFVGEEKGYEQQDGRRSPPIHSNRLKDQRSPEKIHEPKLQPTIPRTPPKSGNPRFLSHGREVVDDELENEESESAHEDSPRKQKAVKGGSNQGDSENEDGDDAQDDEGENNNDRNEDEDEDDD